MTPQLLLTLSPTGQLILERPMAGSRQTIPIVPGQLESTARRILLAQLRAESHLGEDGLPTTAQVNHWNRHTLWTDPSCPFCQSAAAALAPKAKTQHSASRNRPLPIGNGAATVRHIPPSPSDRKALGRKLTTHLSIDELGL